MKIRELLFEDNCNDLTVWTNNDSGTAISSQTNIGNRELFSQNSGAIGGGNTANISRNTGVTGIDKLDIELRSYHASLGTISLVDEFTFVFSFENNKSMFLKLGTDGIYAFSLAGNTLLSNYSIPIKQWLKYNFVLDNSGENPRLKIKINNDIKVSEMDLPFLVSGTAGDANLINIGLSTPNLITYTDYLRIYKYGELNSRRKGIFINPYTNLIENRSIDFASVPSSFQTLINLGLFQTKRSIVLKNRLDVDLKLRFSGDTSLDTIIKEITLKTNKDYILNSFNHDGILQYKYDTAPSSGVVEVLSW